MNGGQCLVERQMHRARPVEVLVDGRWWPGVQYGWRMYDDGTGWRAAVRFVVPGPGSPKARHAHLPMDAVRPLGSPA
ncbi:hypothetical protein [Petropleomorpha daqingensis]|uniref:Uncharacterized protein n=1 Tax=Petropleomorpha daqingensis TaxID=2026353 RepID=A0A853CL45_9ACTN|nr:hypothetical protein [Petropleomorpha daqingensis]NYJ07262.1 hypothetical protein [Petropleomorpha daqingensis]